ncbi:MAG: hypothetical protein J5779_00155 [Clostridia bacterium]|nr:hypothetical protein [Clostridia bacterium]
MSETLNKVLNAFMQTYLGLIELELNDNYSMKYEPIVNVNKQYCNQPKNKTNKQINKEESISANKKLKNNNFLKRESDHINFERH